MLQQHLQIVQVAEPFLMTLEDPDERASRQSRRVRAMFQDVAQLLGRDAHCVKALGHVEGSSIIERDRQAPWSGASIALRVLRATAPRSRSLPSDLAVRPLTFTLAPCPLPFAPFSATRSSFLRSFLRWSPEHCPRGPCGGAWRRDATSRRTISIARPGAPSVWDLSSRMPSSTSSSRIGPSDRVSARIFLLSFLTFAGDAVAPTIGSASRMRRDATRVLCSPVASLRRNQATRRRAAQPLTPEPVTGI